MTIRPRNEALDRVTTDPVGGSAPECEVDNHFNFEAAANGECEWCADIAKAHAAGRAERDKEWRSMAQALLDLHDPEYYYGLTALLTKLPGSDHG